MKKIRSSKIFPGKPLMAPSQARKEGWKAVDNIIKNFPGDVPLEKETVEFQRGYNDAKTYINSAKNPYRNLNKRAEWERGRQHYNDEWYNQRYRADGSRI